MNENKNLISVYSGTEASVLLLKGKLARMGIASEIRKDSNAGYWGVVPDNIELYIEKSNQEEAEPVITSFLNIIRHPGA
ncbi:MAG TPA: hypothetical protein VHO50_11040 [Bacteroidales bacterium]|nr:hypothetical protein [Bacteroidales bacterium]